MQNQQKSNAYKKRKNVHFIHYFTEIWFNAVNTVVLIFTCYFVGLKFCCVNIFRLKYFID